MISVAALLGRVRAPALSVGIGAGVAVAHALVGVLLFVLDLFVRRSPIGGRGCGRRMSARHVGLRWRRRTNEHGSIQSGLGARRPLQKVRLRGLVALWRLVVAVVRHVVHATLICEK